MRQVSRRTIGVLFALTALGGTRVAGQAAAAMPMHQAAPKVLVNVDSRGVGLAGYDPVAFFTDSAAVMGDAHFTASYSGATYQFVSAAHRALFVATPEKYVPQFGGFCAYGASQDHKAPVKIETWQIIGGRLTLNYDLDVQHTFNQDVTGYLQKANANWPGIVEREGKPAAGSR